MLKTIKKHGRVLVMLVLAAIVVFSSGMVVFAGQIQPKETSYRTITRIYDWGAAIPAVIVDLGQPVKQGAVSKDTFSVLVSRTDSRVPTPLLESGYRTVVNAYVSDENGNPVEAGQYVTLEMEVGPTLSLGSPLNYYNGRNEWIRCDYVITQLKDIPSDSGTISGLLADKFAGGIRELVDDFAIGKSTYNGVTLNYAYYAPAKDGQKHPLIIWLHGGGEGGVDATIPLSANKCVNLATEEIQSYFGGAHVLVPQAPTFWMDGFTGAGDGTSIYEDALMSLIKDYVSQNNDIDTNRIYIGGLSNGGYMTMIMIRDYPGYFAAALPVCEPLHDKLITNADLREIMKTPIWFTCAATDPVVPPAIYAVPTYNRLLAAGATNVHLSYFDKVIDTTGLYKKEDGTPYEYNGHWSWIYVYNNECTTVIDGKTVSIMEWMAAQSLSK